MGRVLQRATPSSVEKPLSRTGDTRAKTSAASSTIPVSPMNRRLPAGGLLPTDDFRDQQQPARTSQRDAKAVEVEAGDSAAAKVGEEPTSNDRPDHSDHDVGQQPHPGVGAH